MTSINQTTILPHPMRVKTVKTARIGITIMKPTLTAKHLREMWVLYNRYYDIHQNDFFDKMDSNDFYALYFCEGKLVGFTGIRYRKMKTTFGNQQTLYIGQAVIDEKFRTHSLVPRTCFSFAIRHYLRHPFRPLYVWCDALTYKPYLCFANCLEKFYPTFQETTPDKIEFLLEKIGKHYYKENYQPRKGIVTKSKKIVTDESTIITPYDRSNPHIAFFEEKNPNHIHGSGLLTIAPLDFRNLVKLYKKCIIKGL